MSEKTEAPTPKRLRKAKAEGDGPVSAFASQALGFAFAVALAPAAVRAAWIAASQDLRVAIAHANEVAPPIAFDGTALAIGVLAIVVPILVAAGTVGAVASVVQSGGAIAVGRLSPRWERLDLVAGMRQLVSRQRLYAVLRATIFAVGVAAIGYATLRAHAADLARVSAGGSLDAALVVAGGVSMTLAKRAAALGLFLAVLDIVVTRRSWRKRLMMTKTEVKREAKESEGDPQLRAARERAHHEMLAAATVRNVKTASVVIVNPVHIACALRYDEEGGDEAPVIVASGEGELATKIVEAARQYGVPVLRDIPLARALIEFEVGTAISEALYEAVAEILREVWEEQ